MSRYINLENDIFSLFALSNWIAEKIPTFPINYKIPEGLPEFIRINILPSKPGYNIDSISGILIIEIFSPAGAGSTRTYQIADILDTYLNGKTLKSGTTASNTQFFDSVLDQIGKDIANESLAKAKYQITFNHYGVT